MIGAPVPDSRSSSVSTSLGSSPKAQPTQAVFFDRDNTLIISDGYLGDPAGVKLMPGAAAAVAKARQLGYAVAVVSNQSGVARGLFTEDDVRAVDRRVAEMLRAENAQATLDAQEFCPFHPAAAKAEYRRDSELRKPKPGMFLKCMSELSLRGGWAIGDAPRDIAAAKAAGLRTILFKPAGIPQSPAAEDAGGPGALPDFTATTLEQAMSIIEKETIVARPAAPADTARLERQLDQILAELKKANLPDVEFSVAKLMAGVLQISVIAFGVMIYFRWSEWYLAIKLLGVAILMQSLVTSLLIMGRQK